MTIENICKQITPGAKFAIQLAMGTMYHFYKEG